jgi:hypothetical protein
MYRKYASLNIGCENIKILVDLDYSVRLLRGLSKLVLPDTRIFANSYRRHFPDHLTYRTPGSFVLLPYHINIALLCNKICCYYGVQIKQNGIDWVCISHDRNGKLIENLMAKLECKWIFGSRRLIWWDSIKLDRKYAKYGFDSSGLGWDPFPGFPEHGDDSLGSIKR